MQYILIDHIRLTNTCSLHTHTHTHTHIYIRLINFKKVDKTINDVPLKSLTFQIGQTKWDGGSIILFIFILKMKNTKVLNFFFPIFFINL